MRNTETRTGLNIRGDWLRVGVVSATAIAPLIARWRELQAAERTRELRLRAEHQFDDVRGRIERQVAQITPTAQRLGRLRITRATVTTTPAPTTKTTKTTSATNSDALRTGLWLAGVGIGLIAAGTGAYILVRRRLVADAEEPLVELPLAGTNGSQGIANSNGQLPWSPTQPPQKQRDTAAPSVSGATVSLGEGAEAAPMPDDPDAFGPAEVVEPGMPEPARAPAPERAPQPGRADDGLFAPHLDGLAADTSADDLAQAAFVGNIHTMVYHAVSDVEHLPSEENRVYFASEGEAQAAGFRRARQEGMSSGEETTYPTQTPPA